MGIAEQRPPAHHERDPNVKLLPPASIPSRPRRPAAISVEYMLVLALIVIPIAVTGVPLLTSMIVRYGHRIAWIIRLPLG
jgi:hypothetical protein